MIGMLEGEIANKGAEGILLKVGGIGYDVLCPLTVIDRVPRRGEKCTLSIHTHVREDQITLFGFIDDDQRQLFRLLISVSGIGPKIGLACLSGMSADDLSAAIANADIKRLSGVPGIGKRTAERMVVELKDKVFSSTPGRPAVEHRMLDDLQSALKNLGYKTKDVDQLIADLGQDAGNMSFEALLKEALRKLTRP